MKDDDEMLWMVAYKIGTIQELFSVAVKWCAKNLKQNKKW